MPSILASTAIVLVLQKTPELLVTGQRISLSAKGML